MGLRQRVEKNPAGAAVAAVVALLLCSGWLVYYLWPSRSTDNISFSMTFYTEDDGKTWFAEGYDKLATDFRGPGGKEAVRAVVCQYTGGQKQFVGWMEKYSPRGKALLTEFYADPANKRLPPPLEAQLEKEKLYKRPGMTSWISAKSERGMVMVENIRAMPRNKDGELPVVLAPTRADLASGRKP
jgi:hypothetical protein